MSDIATKETLDSQEAIRNETSSSDSEKALSTHQVEKVEEHSEYDLPPDPDAQLSPEEKAKIVCSYVQLPLNYTDKCRIVHLFGNLILGSCHGYTLLESSIEVIRFDTSL